MMNKLEKWDLIEKKIVFTSKPYNIMKKLYKKPNSEENFAAFVIQCPTWANVIAINSDGKILLIRQFRFGNDEIELEIPGGVIESNENPLDGIKRELKEETGFISKDWKQIGVVNANPAIQNNKCYTFLAKNIENTGERNLDPNEIIKYEFATKEEVKNYIEKGKITNTFIIAAAAFYFAFFQNLN